MKKFLFWYLIRPWIYLFNKIQGTYVIMVREDKFAECVTAYWFSNRSAKISCQSLHFRFNAGDASVRTILEMADSQAPFGIKVFWCYRGEKVYRPIDELKIY